MDWMLLLVLRGGRSVPGRVGTMYAADEGAGCDGSWAACIVWMTGALLEESSERAVCTGRWSVVGCDHSFIGLRPPCSRAAMASSKSASSEASAPRWPECRCLLVIGGRMCASHPTQNAASSSRGFSRRWSGRFETAILCMQVAPHLF